MFVDDERNQISSWVATVVDRAFDISVVDSQCGGARSQLADAQPSQFCEQLRPAGQVAPLGTRGCCFHLARRRSRCSGSSCPRASEGFELSEGFALSAAVGDLAGSAAEAGGRTVSQAAS